MAILRHLQSGVNLITTTDNQENIGSAIPTSTTSQGFSKGIKGTNTDLDSETGFFINTDKNFELWIFYSISGWQLFADVDVIANQGDFATGISVAWLNSTVHGEALGAYFRTDETDHEIRIIRRTKRIKMDLLAGDPDVEKDALVHSLAAANLDYDGEVTGAGTIAHIDIDVSSYIAGQVVTFQREGDFYYGLVQVNNGEELESTLIYNDVTNLMTLTFVLPIEHTEDDNYEFHVSLKESSAPVPIYQLTADNYAVDEGQTVTVTLNTANVADGTQLPYTISGTNIDLNDFDGLGSLTGTFTVNGGTATTSFVTAADQTTEGTEVFTLALDNGEAAVSVTINDESKGIVLEGIKMAVTVGDANYGDGSLQYRLGGRGNYTEINWGDGNTSSYNNIGEQGYDSTAHTYASPGTYIIEVKGNGVINPYAPHHSNTKWNRVGMPLYDASADTSNVGPFGMNRPAIELDFSTVTGLSVSGSTMTITDNANTDWASIVTGASYSDAIGGAMQMSANDERFWSEITSAVTSGNTTTITIANGGFYAQNVGDIEAAILEDGEAAVINDLVTYPIQMVLRPDLNQYPNFQVHNANYGVTNGMWDLDRNLPTVSHVLKLTQITHWGTEFTHSGTRFGNCINMNITATDSPDFTSQSNVTNLFYNCSSLTDPNNTLNTNTFVGPHTTSAHQTFYGCGLYNNDLTNWETENVTDFTGTFNLASSFNGDISTWRVDSCTTMFRMFHKATAFNSPINTSVRGDGNLAWNTSNVFSFQGMFGYTDFNQDISNWNVSGGNTVREMFRDSKFNQSLLTQEVTVGGNTYVAWNTADIAAFDYMFFNASDFNGDITNWDTSYASTFKNMFNNARYFNQNIDKHSVTVTGVGTYDAWDVKRRSGSSDGDKFEGMFYNAYRFNQDLNNWDVSEATDMAYMFYNAKVFNGNISSWDVSNVMYPTDMFNGAYSFNSDISGWNTGNFRTMRQMFNNAHSFDQDLNSWDVSNVTSFYFTFRRARIKTGITGNWNFNNWDTSSATTLQGMFYQHSAGVGQDTTAYGGTVITTTNSQWYPIVTNWDVSNVTTMYQMFQSFVNIGGIDFSNWNPASLTDARDMFQSATYFTGNGFTTLNFPLLQNINGTFWGTSLGNVDVGNLGNSGNLSNIANCFRSLIGDVFTGIGLEHWDISGCTSLSHTFVNCAATVFNGDVSNWNTSNITNLTKAFYGLQGFNRDLSNWNTSSLITGLAAFYNCFALDFSPAGWNISQLEDGTNMWSTGGANTWDQARVDAVMAGWGAQTVQPDVNLLIDVQNGQGIGVPSSGAGLTGYNNLVNNYNWSISIS